MATTADKTEKYIQKLKTYTDKKDKLLAIEENVKQTITIYKIHCNEMKNTLTTMNNIRDKLNNYENTIQMSMNTITSTKKEIDRHFQEILGKTDELNKCVLELHKKLLSK